MIEQLLRASKIAQSLLTCGAIDPRSPTLVSEQPPLLEQFFVGYNRIHGREFRPLGRRGPAVARRLVAAAARRRVQGDS